MSNVVEVQNKDDFINEVVNSEQPVLVDFGQSGVDLVSNLLH